MVDRTEVAVPTANDLTYARRLLLAKRRAFGWKIVTVGLVIFAVTVTIGLVVASWHSFQGPEGEGSEISGLGRTTDDKGYPVFIALTIGAIPAYLTCAAGFIVVFLARPSAAIRGGTRGSFL